MNSRQKIPKFSDFRWGEMKTFLADKKRFNALSKEGKAIFQTYYAAWLKRLGLVKGSPDIKSTMLN